MDQMTHFAIGTGLFHFIFYVFLQHAFPIPEEKLYWSNHYEYKRKYGSKK